MNELAAFHLDAVLGIVLLGYLTFAKWSELRSRRHAVSLPATIVKVFPHRHFTSYFLSYTFEGVARTAEYCGPPLASKGQPGDPLVILIDPRNTPDVPIPDELHNAPGGGVGGGTCSLPETSVITWLDALYAAAAIALIIRSFA
jgi:hypothetical protein